MTFLVQKVPKLTHFSGATLNIHNDLGALFQRSSSQAPECVLVVDSGYSHTTVTPLLRGHPVHSAVRRLNIGGKVFTNRLKELISLRQFNLMDDPYLVNQIKEDTCFVSQDFREDIEKCWKHERKVSEVSSQSLSNGHPVVVDYVLPDYHSSFRGKVRPHEPMSSSPHFYSKMPTGDQMESEESCILSNERFVIPELLFNPSDIGMTQAGLPETVVQSLQCLPSALWPAMLANVLIVGGNAKIPGLVSRFESELRSLVPSECSVSVRCPDDPVSYTWLGGARLASDSSKLKTHLVTREEYFEHGGGWTAKQFSRS